MFNDDINDIKRNWFIAISVLLGIIFISIVIYIISITLNIQEFTPILEKKYEYIIKVLQISGLIFGGIVGCINIFFAAKRAYAMEQSAKAANESAIAANKNAEIALKNVKISEDKQITERFAKAIEQLASDKIEVRLGAIYTLERIAKDSEKDQWTVMEVLTAFVRENAPVKKYDKSQNKKPLLDYWLNTQQEKEIEELPKIRLDIQACLTVIGRRKHKDPEDKRLDLYYTNISQANLRGAYLNKANFYGANLKEAYLYGANFIGAYLRETDFENANLYGVYLRGADIKKSNFRGANLKYANLEGAILIGADLENANLEGAILEGAILKGANLKGAIMPDGKIHD